MLARARRGLMAAGAFRDFQCDRCPQDAHDLAKPAIRVVACVEDCERIATDLRKSSLLLVVCAANRLMEDGASGRVVEVKAAAADKKRRSSSWSGLALPRLCVERNLGSCRKLGFMASTKFRALSLDGFDFSEGDLLSGSRDDISLGDAESLSKESAIGKPSRGRSLDRSFSFDSWRREEDCCILLDAPPKFLHLQAPEEGDRDPDSSWFKSPAAVPFKWEEAPGKPKPEPVDAKPDLRLPPRLLARSCSINPSSGFAQRRARSISHKQGVFLGVDAKAPDPCSPTSILNVPDMSSTSGSASYSESPGSEADSGTSARGRKTKGSIMKTIEKVFQGSWLRKKKFRGSKEADLWAPTLATYFQSVDAVTAKKDEVVVSHSGPAVLVRSSSRREWRTSGPRSGPIGNSEVEESDFEDLEVASCSCPSPMVAPSPRLVRSASSTEHRCFTDQRRKTKRIAKSSNFFQTFMHKAVSSVQFRRKTPLEPSRLSYRPVV